MVASIMGNLLTTATAWNIFFWSMTLPMGLLRIVVGKALLSFPLSWLVSSIVSPTWDMWHVLLRRTLILRDYPFVIAVFDHLPYLPYWIILHVTDCTLYHPLIIFAQYLIGHFETKKDSKFYRKVRHAKCQVSCFVFQTKRTHRYHMPDTSRISHSYSQPHILTISLCQIVHGVLAGDVTTIPEHLPVLILGEIELDGFHLEFNAYPWWARKIYRKLRCVFDCEHRWGPMFSSDPYPLCIHNPAPNIKPAPMIPEYVYDNARFLDRVSLVQLCPFIRTMQSSASPRPPTTLYFSTRGSRLRHSMSFQSPLFAAAELPFCPRVRPLSNIPPYKIFDLVVITSDPIPLDYLVYTLSGRTRTPLYVTPNQILRLLTSGSSPFIIESVQDISEHQANTMDQYVW